MLTVRRVDAHEHLVAPPASGTGTRSIWTTSGGPKRRATAARIVVDPRGCVGCVCAIGFSFGVPYTVR